MILGRNKYILLLGRAPRLDELPWGDEECDALVAILDPELLTEDTAWALSTGLAGLSTDWVETMGERSEYLHDVVDKASVSIGRQTNVGDGHPMTVWHDDLVDPIKMSEYARRGGLGLSGRKIVVIIGSPAASEEFVGALRSAAPFSDE